LFPDTDTGRALLHLVMLAPRAVRQNDPAGGLYINEVHAIAQKPEAALRDVRAALAKMSSARANERQLLVQLASRLPIDREQRLQLLEEEMMKPAKLGPDGLPAPGFFNGTIALACLLDIARDAKEALPIVERAVRAQTNKDAQRVLLAAFYPSAPAQAKRLMNELDLFEVEEKQP